MPLRDGKPEGLFLDRGIGDGHFVGALVPQPSPARRSSYQAKAFATSDFAACRTNKRGISRRAF